MSDARETTISIRISNQDDLDKVTAYLSRFGHIQQSRSGDSYVLIYQPIETVSKDYHGSSTTTSRVFQVSRALINKGVTDGLNPWDYMKEHERDEVLVWLTDKRRKELEIAKDNMERCQRQWELRMAEFSAENPAGTTRRRKCPVLVPRSEWLPDLQLIGEYKTTVEAHIPGPMANPILERVVETVVEIENAEEEDVPPAMRRAPLTHMGIKLDPDEFMRASSLGSATSPLGDSGLGPNSPDVADRLLACRLDAESPRVSIFDSPQQWSSTPRPEHVVRSPATEQRSVPMSHQEVIWKVEEFVKQARREEEAREAEEAEHEGVHLSTMAYHKRKFEAEAERLEIAATLDKRNRPSESRSIMFGKGKGRGTSSKK